MFKLQDIEIDATGYLDLALNAPKNAFGGRALPGPAGAAYSAPQTP